jgi:O-antigen biosynthesis protein
MRRLFPAETFDIYNTSGTSWDSHGDDPILIFDTRTLKSGYFLLFVKTMVANWSPKLYLDQGEGFSEASAFQLKSLPSAIYYVPIAVFPQLQRIRFDPADGVTRFHLLAFHVDTIWWISPLHYFMFARLYSQVLEKNVTTRSFFIKAIRGSIFRWMKTTDAFAAQCNDLYTKMFKLRKRMASDLAVIMKRLSTDIQLRLKDPIQEGPMILISFIVPTYNTRPCYLKDLVNSFRLQNANYAELILSDDGSTVPETIAALNEIDKDKDNVRVIMNGVNRGIALATNEGIFASHGEWISFIDHDDAFFVNAVRVIAKAIRTYPAAEFFYTDEFLTDRDLTPVEVYCKPAFDSVLLSGMNYINHFSIYKRDRLEQIACMRAGVDGSQDFDLLLRYLDGMKRGSIYHIPYPAYLWRRGGETFSTQFIKKATNNARVALKLAYSRRHRDIDVVPARNPELHRIMFLTNRHAPTVSIIIPNKDSFRLISTLLFGLRSVTSYKRTEIIVVDNGSTDKDVLQLYESLSTSDITFHYEIRVEPFNFSRMCNRGAALAAGSVFLFLNNDIEVIEPDWLLEMVNCLEFPETGIVGCQLLYPDHTIQHNGVIVGLGGLAGHWYLNSAEDEPGPMGRFQVRQSMTCVTAACMLITRKCLDTLHGFDEVVFPVAYNDVDLCIRAYERGFRIVWTPFAKLLHKESASRGSDDTPENIMRFKRDKAALQSKHHTEALIDDAYSPLFDRWHSIPSIGTLTELPVPRTNKFC